MPSLDTNIVLRWLLDDVEEQTAAADALLAGPERCDVPDVVLIETVYVLERVMRLSRVTIVQSIEALFAVAGVDADRALWRTALDDYLAHPKLSVADTYLAARAQATQRLPLYTFDRKLANQLAAAELVTSRPASGRSGRD